MSEGGDGDRDGGLGPPRPAVPAAARETISEALRDPEERSRMGFAAQSDAAVPVIIELNVAHPGGTEAARQRLFALLERDLGRTEPLQSVTGTLYRGRLSVDEVRTIVRADAADTGRRDRAIHRVWPDFPLRPLIDRSIPTVKADAARRSFGADGAGIVWAVVDSGIDARHAHFQEHDNLGGDVSALHRDFTRPHPDVAQSVSAAREDGFGHGTHVAGIIAGELPRGRWDEVGARVAERVRDPATGDVAYEERDRGRVGELTGVAPRCALVSLRVLDDEGNGSTSNIIEALRYVREVNASGKGLRIHGVNLSLGYEFDAKWFACGQSPLCVEVNELVRSGVVVVAAAGNTGYGRMAARARATSAGMALTINDPGNAELAITVGATHRDHPYTYGVSYFSSKGPTGDGRLKPDLVAPGEKITSCATGALAAGISGGPGDGGRAQYVDDDGTSVAAPHVSGAAAAFLSIRREFIQQPQRLKQILMDSASSLGRVPDFEGRGLLDLMRALSSV